MSDVVHVPSTAGAVHPFEDEAMRRALRRNQIVAATIARMPGLNRSLVGETPAETQANVEAVGLTLAFYGVALNGINVNQFDQIPPGSGQMVPRTQLLMALVTELTGDELWTGDCDEKSATVYLRRGDTGRVFDATYTVEQARASHALDFTFVRWAKTQNGKSYPAETLIVGTDEAEVYAARDAWPKWAEGEPKCNPAWHHFRADMLQRRAFKRVIKIGRPGVTAGVLAFDSPPQLPPPPGATITVNMAFDDDEAPALPPAVITTRQEPVPSPPAPDGPRPSMVQVMLLASRLVVLPPDWRHAFDLALDASGLPRVESDDFEVEHIAKAVEVLDRIEARMAETSAAYPAEPDGTRGHGAASRGATETPARSVDAEPARPLAQQIAMQAQVAGIDHHHVIAAVTVGEKSSANDVTVEEGKLALQAIAAIAKGEYSLGERDGQWVFVDPPEGRLWDAPDEDHD